MHSGRIEVLDSLRGVAAMQVVFNHFLIVFPLFFEATLHLASNQPLMAKLMVYTPLHILWAGHEAVIFFFTLSGFVLSLPYVNRNPLFYRPYLIRRFCRIYIPFFTLISLSLILYKRGLGFFAIPGVSCWTNSFFSKTITWREMLKIYTGFDDIYTYNLAPTVWSLNHEMRISIVFPFLANMVVKLNWRENLGMGFLLAALGGGLINEKILSAGELNRTFFYTSFFIFGALLAKHRDWVLGAIGKYNGGLRTLFLASALILYNIRWSGLVEEKSSFSPVGHEVFCDLSVGLASLYFIGASLGWKLNKKNFVQGTFLWIGKISFSLYLIHPLILFMSIYYFRHFLPIIISDFLGLSFAIFVAWLFYRWIECPSTQLGKKLSKHSIFTG